MNIKPSCEVLYNGKPLYKMSEIELKSLLLILINDCDKERLYQIVKFIGGTHYKETIDADLLLQAIYDNIWGYKSSLLKRHGITKEIENGM